MGSVEDTCIVCAEPLEFSGVGTCGHKETCSKCVARWRFVLKDNRCIMCKQEQPTVLFTRFMGDYTARLDPNQDLKARASRDC
jgi:recombinational DNA repair protein (RecF pathway)